jgi:hypothetical protein
MPVETSIKVCSAAVWSIRLFFGVLIPMVVYLFFALLDALKSRRREAPRCAPTSHPVPAPTEGERLENSLK